MLFIFGRLSDLFFDFDFRRFWKIPKIERWACVICCLERKKESIDEVKKLSDVIHWATVVVFVAVASSTWRRNNFFLPHFCI